MYDSFSGRDRCRIGNRFLPNNMSVLARYTGKAFCGTYSPDGNYFISACQGKLENQSSEIGTGIGSFFSCCRPADTSL